MPVGHYAYDTTLTFPDRGWQVVSFAVYTICLVVNTGLIARRLRQYRKTFTRFRPLDSLWLCDVLVTLTFLISFLFIVTNGILTFAIGTNMTETCDASVTICVSAFVLSKVVLYLYYLERLYLLNWAKDPKHTEPPHMLARLRVVPWLAGIFIFVFGVPCAVLLGFSREFQLIVNGNDGSKPVGCHVFLRYQLASPIIVWCAVINAYMLVAFWLHMRKGGLKQEPVLKRNAKLSIWALLVSGLSTVINLSVLLILKGEHGLECLLCCSIDVMANSLVLYMASDRRGEAFSFPSLTRVAHEPASHFVDSHHLQAEKDPLSASEEKEPIIV